MYWQDAVSDWFNYPEMDIELKRELMDLKKNEESLKDAFYAPLEFGTAGMRGIIGAGINRMNLYTVRQAAEGLALFIESQESKTKNQGVVIAYDSRHYSPEFGLAAAQVLAKHRIKVYLFSSLRPTPELSFAVRHLNCSAGIMITASHNPAEYNGFKVYGSDGSQMAPQAADSLTNFVRSVKNPLQVEFAEQGKDSSYSLIQLIDNEVDESYLENLKTISLDKELINQYSSKLKIVYTPLHGAGAMLGEKALTQVGFESVVLEPSQALPDSDFTTVESPNPEEYAAFEYAIKLGRKESADLLIATDPDADRMGAAVKLPNGKYQILTGNQIAALLINYLLLKKEKDKLLTSKSTVIKSIVSSELGTKICNKYNVDMINVLTGFKFIGEKIANFEISKEKEFLFGYEESYGFLVKPFVRDKDALQAMILLAEVAVYYKSKKLTLYDGLLEIFEEFGYFEEKTISIMMDGINGAQKISNLMQRMRANPIKDFSSLRVILTEDYSNQTRISDVEKKEKINLPQSNVLKYYLEDGSWIAIRPSGTEPKVKFYIGVQGQSLENTSEKIHELEKMINKIINQ